MEFSSSISQDVSPPPAPARHTRLYPLLIVSLLLAGLMTAAYYAFPIWQKSRADSLASAAQDAYEQGHLPEAQRSVEAALVIRPTDPRYLRLAARILSNERKADSFAFYKALMRSPEATEKDRYELIQLAFLFGRPEVASPVIKEFLRRKPVTARTYFLAALLEDSLRNRDKALVHARAALRENPDNQEHALFLARLLAETGSLDEAKNVLFMFGEKSVTGRLPAIRALAAMELTQEEVRKIIEWLGFTPISAAADWAMGYEMLYRADTNRLASLSEEAIQKLPPAMMEQQIGLGIWFNRHGLFEKTLQVVKPDPQLRRRRLSAIYLDALIGLGRWEDALNFLGKAEEAGSIEVALAGYRKLETNSPTAETARAAVSRLEKDRAPAR